MRTGSTPDAPAKKMLRARVDIFIIRAALLILQRIARDRLTVARNPYAARLETLKSRQPSGKFLAEKNAFVLVMAECWLFLSGKLPTVSDKAGFEKFVASGWTSWKGRAGASENFRRAIEAAIDGLKGRTEADRTTQPHWL